jgi:hypothetical protein
MKLKVILILLIALCRFCLRLKTNNNIVLKLTENLYNKIEENYNQFETLLFKEIEQNPTDLDNILYDIENGSSVNKTLNRNITRAKDIRLFNGDYYSFHRVIRLYISHTQQCSVFINDTSFYNTTSSLNFVEHMILHNNAEHIEPRGVYSDDLVINFFAFNKKMNIFSVNFDEIKPSAFKLEFNYDAINLIKTNMYKDNNYTDHNSLVWKVINQNFVRIPQNVTVEIYFDLGKDFINEDVEFYLNFTKSIEYDKLKTNVKYQWNGLLQPQEVVIIQVNFPLYFENCGYISVNWLMILIGAIFLSLLVGMLYLIITTVFFEEIG